MRLELHHTTKNGESREFQMTPELRALLDRRRDSRGVSSAPRSRDRLVFHRRGRAIRSLRRSWLTATKAAGRPGTVLHDLRRSAVRNLEHAGVSRSVAMKLTGHKTEAIFRRYAISSTSDLRDAAAKLAALGDNSGPLELQDPARRRGSTRKVVGRDGIEPPTPGFSVLCSTN